MESAVAFIFARGGSKGLPNKALALLGGVTLLERAVMTAQKCPGVHKIVLSTDSPDIAAAGTKCGAEVPFLRPASLSTDTSPEWLAWQHAISFYLEKYGQNSIPMFLSVPVTSPLRSSEDLIDCIRYLKSTDADVVLPVTRSTRNPFFNMALKGVGGELKLAVKPPVPITRRQDAPETFDLTTVGFASRPQFILRSAGMWDGKVVGFEIPADRAVDIDTPMDLAWAEFLLRRQSV